jgi:uncharacterized protein YbbK (DUF523 family)
LSTPRCPAEQKKNKIYTEKGKDVTINYKKGSEEALRIALLTKCNEAILKSKSPACGCGKIYDGTFSGKLVDGDGVFVKMLKDNNIKIYSEKDI